MVVTFELVQGELPTKLKCTWYHPPKTNTPNMTQNQDKNATDFSVVLIRTRAQMCDCKGNNVNGVHAKRTNNKVLGVVTQIVSKISNFKSSPFEYNNSK